MKILFLVRDLGLGGVERCVALVASGLATRGFDVTIAMLGGEQNLWSSHTRSVHVVSLASCWHGKKPWTWFAGWRAARRLAKQADVVIAATFLMPLYMAWAITRGLSQRLIGWVHGPKQELDRFAHMHPVHRHACQFIYRRLPELVFVSQHARESMSRWTRHPIQPGWRVLPNFNQPDSRPACPPRENPHSPLQLLFVGRIAEEKQPQLWLDTLLALNKRQLPAHLTVVGDGPLQEWVQQQVHHLGLSTQITLEGRRENVADYLLSADILLLSSNFEGCPLVVLEALEAGLPVVSTNAGGVYELFGERQHDFVCSLASGEALAEKIAFQLPIYAELSAWEKQRAQSYTEEAALVKWVNLLQNKESS